MKDVETLIYSRMINDNVGSDSLVYLLGNSGRISYAFQSGPPQVPQVTYFLYSSGPGLLVGDFCRTWEESYQFSVFSNIHPDIIFRLKRLFDGMVFTVPGSYQQLGQVSSVWDWEGADGFDENLEVMTKEVRFRFFAVPKVQIPI